MTSFRQFLEEELRNEKFAREYQDVRAELRFGLALALRREELGLTQQELAMETGIKQPMIARIEHGQMPTAPTLQRLAKALKAQVVFTGEEVRLEAGMNAKEIEETLEKGVNMPGSVVDIEQFKRSRKPWVGRPSHGEEDYDAPITAAFG
jgi:transcriptional regulator with XRE-family HTH domain